MKWSAILLVVVFVGVMGTSTVLAATSATYYLSDTCKYCVELQPWLEQIKTKYPQLQITEKEISKNQDNEQEFIHLMTRSHIAREDWGIPAIYINGKILLGTDEIMARLEAECRE